MTNLVIVESPAKANTIKGYLGSGYKVIASKGHIRDLPKSSIGIDIENNFEPHYISIRGKGDVIKQLKAEAKNAKKIFLATDPDREGEAISWHIATQLGIPEDRACRVTFNEITKSAVKSAIKQPRTINMDLVNSQQARRILDRLVGFSLSEILWKKIKSGLSGGRVQSVATKIITQREEEIANFVAQEYWTLDVLVNSPLNEQLKIRFYGDRNGKIKLNNKADAEKIENVIKHGNFNVINARHIEKEKTPPPPFITSTLQQEASKKLGYQTQKIMKIAQELYDGINLGTEFGGFQGLITYMRTDSTRVSDMAKEAAKNYILSNYGEEFVSQKERNYKTSTNSQDAHEAIRPSNLEIRPDKVKKILSGEQYKIYKLIWDRFLASQMASAILDTVSVDIDNSGYLFKVSGQVVKSKGYMTIYNLLDEEVNEDEINLSRLPNVKKYDSLKLSDIIKTQHFTEPPARYTEASLIKFLEENGIGRPSTYAPIISIIISRNYVKREGKSLVATELGKITTKFMNEYFPEIVDYEFTASMEDKLDSIENRDNTILGVISGFYENFKKELDAAENIAPWNDIFPTFEESDIICEKCGEKMVYKTGRFGRFLACSAYPKCRNTKAVDSDGKVIEQTEPKLEIAPFKCELCGGDMVVRKGKYGIFYACANYPECKFTKQKEIDTGVKCPKCGKRILAHHGKRNSVYYSCENYPECDFSSWDMPLNEKCPVCSGMLYYRKSRKQVICKSKNCDYKRDQEMTVIE